MTKAPLAPPSRRSDLLIAAAAAVMLLCLLFYAANSWAMASYRLLSDGLLALVWVISAWGWGGLARLKQATPPSMVGIVSAAALGLGFLSIVFLLLGLAGWLNFWTVAALLAIGLALALSRWVMARRALALHPLSTRWLWLWLAVMPVLSMTLMAAMVPPGVLWRGEPNGYDVVEYHLQVPREWYEAGRITPLEHNVFSYMPMNVEMQYLAAMELRGGPWAGMYLSQYLHMAFMVLTVLAIYGFSGQSGGPASAVLAAVAAALVPWLSLLAPIAYNEGGLLLFGTLSIGWAMRGMSCRKAAACGAPLVLAGLFAGLACGTKLTAVPMVLVAIPIAWIAVWIIGRFNWNPEPGTRNPIPSVILFVIAGLLAFCPWLIRNQLWAGNPVFPELMPLLGSDYFTPTQVERYQRAHSPRPDQHSIGAHLRAGWNQIIADWAYGYVLLPIGLLAGVLALVQRRRQAVFLWLMLILLAIIWIGFTHLQGRFFILAIPILALMLGQVKWGLWQWPLAAVILAGGAVGFVGLNGQLLAWLEPGLLGMENFHAFMEELLPPEALKKVDAGQSLALAGDARAFLYQIPMRRLHYRTVFDVKADPGEGLIQAWVGGAKADLIVVDPSELRRLTRTYYGLPPLPAAVETQDKPYIFHP